MKIKFVKENLDIPFPQANDVYKILKFVDNLLGNKHEKTFSTISEDYVPRQQMYYKTAAQYLDLLRGVKPTQWAQKVFALEPSFIFTATVHSILSHEVFYKYFITKSSSDVVEYLKRVYQLSDTTAKRRLSTVKKWIEWCEIIIKENDLEVIHES